MAAEFVTGRMVSFSLSEPILVLFISFFVTLSVSAPYSRFVEYEGRGALVISTASRHLAFSREFFFSGQSFDSLMVHRDGSLELRDSETGSNVSLSVFKTSPSPTYGSVYHRFISTDENDDVGSELQDALTAMNVSFGSVLVDHSPHWAVIVTWHDMSMGNVNHNTFQAILLAMQESVASFVLYNYGSIQWPTRADQGECIAGYNTSFSTGYIIPGSQVGDSVGVMEVSNIDQPGMWAFRVDQHQTSLESEADSFYLAFAPPLNQRSRHKPYILVSTSEEGRVPITVDCPGIRLHQEATILKDSAYRLNFPSSLSSSYFQSNGGIRVTTTKGKKISVVAVSEVSPQYVTRYSVLHQRDLKRNYVYYVTTADDSQSTFTHLVIVGMYDRTRVKIHAPVLLRAGRRTVGANQVIELTIHEYRTLYVVARQDLSGMKIVSFSKPVAVFSGHACTQIPSRYTRCDSIMEQLPSTYDWGRKFVIPPMYGRSYSLLHVFAAADLTQFNLDCITKSGRQKERENVMIDSAGAHAVVQQSGSEICYLSANSSVLAVQFSISVAADTDSRQGGPAMLMIPSVQQFSKNAVVPALQASLEHSATIIVPEQYHHPSLIYINNETTLQNLTNTPLVYYNNYTISHYVYSVELQTAGVYHIHSEQPGARLGVIAVGHRESSSYAYMASIHSSGAKFESPLVKVIRGTDYAVCLTTTTQHSSTFWRDENGQVISTDSVLYANSSASSDFYCEVPALGFQPEFYYREKYTPSTLAISIQRGSTTGGGQNCDAEDCKTKCSFTVRVFPESATANIYSNITLYCTASVEEDIVSMKWSRAGSTVDEGPVMYLMQAGPQDAGTYTCTVTRTGGETGMASANVTILSYPPVITIHPTSVYTVLNEINTPIRLQCSAEYAGGLLWWEKLLSSNQHRRLQNWDILKSGRSTQNEILIDQSGDLLLLSPSRTSGGVYRCVAFNESGRAVSNPASVVIEGTQPLTIVMSPLNQTILINTTAVLRCLATGYGHIHYNWTRGNATVQGRAVDRGSELDVVDQDEDSEGEYTCVAYTEDEVVSSPQAFIRVLKPDKALAASVHPLNESVYEGRDAAFHCHGAHGQGDYTYLWMNDVDQAFGNTSTLVLSRVSMSHSGLYTCVVEDEMGMKTNATARLLVQDTKEPNITIPTIKNVTLSLVDRSRYAVFECDVGQDGMAYTWRKQEGPLPNRALGVNSSTLVLPVLALADAGKYQCSVTHLETRENATSAWAYLSLSVAPPTIKHHPANLTTALGGNVSLSCIAEGYGSLLYRWNRVGVGLVQTGSSPHLFLNNVTKSAEGQYKCSVTNQNGEASTSNFATITVRVSERVEVQNCNRTLLSSTLLSQNLRAPSFLKTDTLLLQGPIFSTSKQLSKDMKLLANSLVYVCHKGVQKSKGRSSTLQALTLGIAIEPDWVMTLSTICTGMCRNEQFDIVPLKQLSKYTNPAMKICKEIAGRGKAISVESDTSIHKSPANSSVLLLQLKRPLLTSYISKGSLLSRSQLLKLKSGNAVDLLGISSTESSTPPTPKRFKFRIRSKLPPSNAPLPAVTSQDSCSENLPESCSWFPGSPIVYQPPQSAKYALLGLAASQDGCSAAGIYESHISLSTDMEWIDETVV
uniref:Perlecan-like protein n=1 Tax=Halisarca dujardinii TaxID=2583056 RepID=A0AA96S0W2_HALDU|nr:perlecan-like protein [Halisarca dujardinii]